MAGILVVVKTRAQYEVKSITQVRWDDQPQYHQEIEGVFVGGRLVPAATPC